MSDRNKWIKNTSKKNKTDREVDEVSFSERLEDKQTQLLVSFMGIKELVLLGFIDRMR